VAGDARINHPKTRKQEKGKIYIRRRRRLI
jgi:hypothetical protein